MGGGGRVAGWGRGELTGARVGGRWQTGRMGWGGVGGGRPVRLSDLVVPRSQVGAGGDEVDVEVVVVVLLKLCRREPVARER